MVENELQHQPSNLAQNSRVLESFKHIKTKNNFESNFVKNKHNGGLENGVSKKNTNFSFNSPGLNRSNNVKRELNEGDNSEYSSLLRNRSGTREREQQSNILKTAGLSSDRCVRDFLTANYRKFFNNTSTMVRDSLGGYDSDPMANNHDYNSNVNRTKRMKRDAELDDDIFKSNCVLRHKNRLRNTAHSDIFGVNETNSRRTQPTSLASKCDPNDSLDGSTNWNSRSVSTFSDKDTDSVVKRDGDAESTQQMDDEWYTEQRLDRQLEHSEDQHSDHYSQDNSCKSSLNGDFSQETSSLDGGGTREEGSSRGKKPRREAENIEIQALRLSGLKPDASERELVHLCSEAGLRIISVALDRNIINHTCAGTARVVVKNAHPAELAGFQALLRSAGMSYKV